MILYTAQQTQSWQIGNTLDEKKTTDFEISSIVQ